MARRDYIIVETVRRRSHRHREHSSSSSGHHHSSSSHSSRHEPSYSSYHGEGGSRDYNPGPWSSSANQYQDPNVTPTYTHSQYYSSPVSYTYPQYEYHQGPIRVYRRVDEGISYRYGSYEPSGSSYFPPREASTCETGYSNGEACHSPEPILPHDTVNETADNAPLPIHQAIIRGEEAMKTLRDTIRVVLLHEWCRSKKGNIYPPDEDFKTAIRVIPVRRHRHGALQPIESAGNKWGVKTGYYPEHDLYLPTIMIRVPPELHVSEAKLKAAYKRFFVDARNELLEDVLEIPFKDNQEWRNYGMLFTFNQGSKHGSKSPRLFDDYLGEDAVIRARA
ncbi:hypothetical protein F4803DRAFT_528309 [Xylaria telfairii]|nr:hypothetical protein F4803DRAFT_528309 [Xylaria telfairii]